MRMFDDDRSAWVSALPAVGIFGGGFNSLTLQYERGALTSVTAVLAQDLRGNTSINVLGAGVTKRGDDTLEVDGALIATLGLHDRSSPSDVSEPGLVLVPTM
jgi:hypothetical protein